MKGLPKEKWIEEGLRILGESSYVDIKIDHLCRQLNRSKGSFYHHFKDIKDYYSHLFDSLGKCQTKDLDKTIEVSPTPKEKLKLVNEFIIKNVCKEMTSLRAWATHNYQAREFIDKADITKLEYLTKLYSDVGFDPKRAKSRAKLNLALLVGIYQLYNDSTDSELNELITGIKEIID